LGIPEAAFQPDPSPLRSPGGEKLAKAEKGELETHESEKPDIAQRIEAKFLEYSASGSVFKRWLLEIISLMLSASCMGAIIIICLVLQNKPQPTNWAMGLTPNGLIAILSKIASAALLLPAAEALGQLKWSWFQGSESKKMWDFEIFDSASRGPWGCFLLLLRTRGRSLAALGAAITIFAMILDPFFEQLVYNTKQWELQASASLIPKVTRYEAMNVKEFREVEVEGNITSTEPMITVDMGIDAIVYKFVFEGGVEEIQVGNSTRPEIPITCPTSNCTWEPYDTLGVCSKCADVADMLEFGCHRAQFDWAQNATSYLPYINGTACGWFFNITSAKPVLMTGYQADPDTLEPLGPVLANRVLPLITNLNRRPIFGGSVNFQNVRNPITDFIVVSSADGPDDEHVLESIFRHEKPRALECILTWCVKTLQSSYSEATYSETVTKTFINTTEGPFPWHQMIVEPPPVDMPDAVQYIYFQNITLEPGWAAAGEEAPRYGVGNDTAFNIIAVFDQYFPAFTTYQENSSEPIVKYHTRSETPSFRTYSRNPWLAPNNVTHYLERIATVMTNHLRELSNEHVEGKSFEEEMFVKVSWAWLALPLALLLLTTVFLVATVVRTLLETDKAGVWKNSAIAALRYGLPEKLQQKITASQADGTLHAKAKEMHLRMSPKRGWRISRHPFTPDLRKSKAEPPPGWI
jgi:hypothetical protein